MSATVHRIRPRPRKGPKIRRTDTLEEHLIDLEVTADLAGVSQDVVIDVLRAHSAVILQGLAAGRQPMLMGIGIAGLYRSDGVLQLRIWPSQDFERFLQRMPDRCK